MSLAVADRLDILDVLARADNAASRRDRDAYVELFTDDVVLDGDQGTHVGKETLRQAVGPIWANEGTATLHLTLNPTLENVGSSGDEVMAHSVLLIVQPGASPHILTAANITQRLRRIGVFWRIGHRTVKTTT
jgi:ketosteroid isomerase-like protein